MDLGRVTAASASGGPAEAERAAGHFEQARANMPTQAGPALGATLEHYSYLASLTADWYWEQDSDLRFARVEQTLAGRSRLAPESYLGKRRWEIEGQIHDPDFWAPHRAVLEARLSFRDLEYPVHRPDGELSWFSVSGDPIFAASGEFLGYRGIGRDITRRRLAEEALQANEERLRLAFVASHEGLWDWNVDSGSVFYSPRWRQMLGYAEGDIAADASAWRDLLHPDDRAPALAKFKDMLRGADTIEFEFRLRHKSGRYVPILSRGVAVRTAPSGRVKRVVGTHLDLTERKDAENRQRALTQFNVGLLDAMAAQICALDAEGNIIVTNAVWRRLAEGTNVSRSSILEGANYFAVCDSVTGDDADVAHAVARGLREIARGSRAQFTCDYRCSRTDRDRWYRLIATHVAGGGPACMVVAHHEITDQVRIRDALSASLLEKETLLREMHHRVKNNLQIISSLLHFHAQRMPDSLGRQVFEEGQMRLRAMMLLHEGLYAQNDFSAIDLGTYVRALVSQLHASHQGTSGRITCIVEAQSISTPIQIAMPCGLLVGELIGNSLKHAFPQNLRGCIRVEVRVEERTLRIEVADDGVGMPAIADGSRSRGFGLRLVEKLLDQLGASARRQTHGGVRTLIDVPFSPSSTAGAQV